MLNTGRAKKALDQVQKTGTYTTTAGELLRDWGDLYEPAQTHTAYYLGQIVKNLTIESGSINHRYYHESIGKFDNRIDYTDALNCFGLAYTSSSSYAALWVCNVSAVLTLDKTLRLHGVALNTEFQAVFCFEKYDNDGNEIASVYFNEIQMYQYLEQLENNEKNRAIDELTENTFNIADAVVEILKKYAGKPYGEKTRKKIADEIRAAAGGYWAYLTDSGLSVSTRNEYAGNIEKRLYFDYLSSDNKVLSEIIPYKARPEKTATQAQRENDELRQKIKAICKDLLPLLEQYNNNARIAYRDTTKTDIHRTAVYTIAEYGI